MPVVVLVLVPPNVVVSSVENRVFSGVESSADY